MEVVAVAAVELGLRLGQSWWKVGHTEMQVVLQDVVAAVEPFPAAAAVARVVVLAVGQVLVAIGRVVVVAHELHLFEEESD